MENIYTCVYDLFVGSLIICNAIADTPATADSIYLHENDVREVNYIVDL